MADACEKVGDCPLGSPQTAWSLVAEITRASADIVAIKRSIHGNGRDGLLADVARLNLKMNIVCFVSGVLLTATVAILVKLLA
jgi:hypothetical protein